MSSLIGKEPRSKVFQLNGYGGGGGGGGVALINYYVEYNSCALVKRQALKEDSCTTQLYQENPLQ